MRKAEGDREPLFDRRDLGPILAILAVGAYAFAQSHGRWLDPVIDTGRDLYIPGELAEGRKLYRDILYYYPPLTPHLLWLLTSLVGRSLPSYTLLGVLVAAMTAITLYLLGRQASNRVGGAVAALLFASLNFTGASSWGCNFLFPYAHAATLGMLFLLLFLLFLQLALFNQNGVRRLAFRHVQGNLALLFGLAACWTKLELTAIVLITLMVAVFWYRIGWRYLASFFTAAAGSLAIVEWIFRDSPPGRHWLFDNVLASSLLGGPIAERFYGQVSGTSHLAQSAVEIALGAIFMMAAGGCVVYLDRSPRRPLPLLATLAVLSIVTALVASERFFQSWALFLLVLAPLAIRDRSGPLLLLWLPGFGAALRIYLNLSPAWYGFTLILPLYPLIAHVLFRQLPQRGLYSFRSSLLWLPLFLLLMGRGLHHQGAMYELKSEKIDTVQGTLYDLPSRAAVIRPFLESLSSSRGTTLVAIPEGLTLNYLSGTDNPLAFHTFTPIEAAGQEIESQILEDFRERKPHLVALVTRDVSEFGYRGFGIDYDLELMAYLRREYRPWRQFKAARFEILLLRRNR